MKSHGSSIITLYILRTTRCIQQFQQLEGSKISPSWSTVWNLDVFWSKSWKQMEDNDYEGVWWRIRSSTVHNHEEFSTCHWCSRFCNSWNLYVFGFNLHKQNFNLTYTWRFKQKLARTMVNFDEMVKKCLCENGEKVREFGDFLDLIWKLWLFPEFLL